MTLHVEAPYVSEHVGADRVATQPGDGALLYGISVVRWGDQLGLEHKEAGAHTLSHHKHSKQHNTTSITVTHSVTHAVGQEFLRHAVVQQSFHHLKSSALQLQLLPQGLL